MEKKIKQLKAYLAEIYDLSRIDAVLSWDQQTYMPPGGAGDRGNQLALLARLVHERKTSPRLGRLLDSLASYAEGLDPTTDEASLIRVVRKEFDKNLRVPSTWVSEFARVTTLSQEAWVQARAENNFAAFRPHLEKVVALRRQYASFFAPYQHVYDPLLDDFEPGMKTAEVQSIFSILRSEQVALVKAILARGPVESEFLFLEYPEEAQRDFGIEVIKRFGYDFERGRLDRAAHPFSTSFGLGDVRITTRFNPKYLSSALFGTMHESGHALYDMGYDPSLDRTPLADGASMAIHESQSRMWENLVGRSLPFWRFFYPRLQQVFPAQLGKVALETFYKAINRVQPSLIRVEADEATYNLHIMLRLELEIALMEGSLEVKDLPSAWNQRMQDFVGLTPPTDAQGVMQDIHWSGGMIGYFPTYALGNLVSAQLWERINADIPDLEDQIQHGEFGALLGWLRKNVHRHGCKYEPQDLVRRVTGSPIDPRPYLRYLKAKYTRIYGL
jgi:carboxypeptidase Taq